MAVPKSWRSGSEPAGAFALRVTLTAESDWKEFDISAITIATRADITEITNNQPFNGTYLRQNAILRSVSVQNVGDTNDALLSDMAGEVVGETGSPTPTDAYHTVMANGGISGLVWSSAEAQTTFQYRSASGTTLNAEIRFDVPVNSMEPSDLNPGLS